MGIVKVLYADANGDYTEVSNLTDVIQAFGFDAASQKITNVANGVDPRSGVRSANCGGLAEMARPRPKPVNLTRFVPT